MLPKLVALSVLISLSVVSATTTNAISKKIQERLLSQTEAARREPAEEFKCHG